MLEPKLCHGSVGFIPEVIKAETNIGKYALNSRGDKSRVGSGLCPSMFFSENSLTGSVLTRFMHAVTHSSLAEPSINDQSSGACIATVLMRVHMAMETSQSLLTELISVSKKLSGDCRLCVKFAKIHQQE
jgi:hypothetical protein